VFTRLEPGGSCLVGMVSWHEDDLGGRLKREGWERVVLPAIDVKGRSLWPERWSIESLRERQTRLGEYSWASLYMGQPFSRGGTLFRDVHFYDELPEALQRAMREGAVRLGKGIDLAYSAKTHSDRSAAVVMIEWAGMFYVIDVRTARVRVPEFLRILSELDATYDGMWHWYASGTERGVADLATSMAGVAIEVQSASADKFVRAQGVSAAWNAGKVLVPRMARSVHRRSLWILRNRRSARRPGRCTSQCVCAHRMGNARRLYPRRILRDQRARSVANRSSTRRTCAIHGWRISLFLTQE
jgi:phage terminase large subunit-like protein